MLTSFKRNRASCEGAKDESKDQEVKNYGKDINFDAVEDPTKNIQNINDDPSFRKLIGSSMGNVSDFINENLIAARYGAMATIFLLTAYGISNTPLFFRFRTVHEIPCKLYVNVFSG